MSLFGNDEAPALREQLRRAHEAAEHQQQLLTAAADDAAAAATRIAALETHAQELQHETRRQERRLLQDFSESRAVTERLLADGRASTARLSAALEQAEAQLAARGVLFSFGFGTESSTLEVLRFAIDDCIDAVQGAARAHIAASDVLVGMRASRAFWAGVMAAQLGGDISVPRCALQWRALLWPMLTAPMRARIRICSACSSTWRA